MKRNFQNYNKQELIEKINRISIEKIEDKIVTKYGDTVTSVSEVSNRYEIFDIKSYLINKIDLIEKNFSITKYYFRITKGIQELTLLSDTIEINGVNFQKSFFILNSSDKEDLCRCLKQEMEDNIGMCAQGNLSRLCNILAGYMEGIGSQESLVEILGREFSKLMEIESMEERLTKAFYVLKENNVPIVDWKKWLDPLTCDQDVEMEVGFIRNSNDEIIGFNALEV
jgi:threonyl-tRNA synthetase